jgi:hypothetical protein
MISQLPIHINQTVGFILRAAGRERKTKQLIVQEEGKIELNQKESFWNQTKASTALEKEKEKERDSGTENNETRTNRCEIPSSGGCRKATSNCVERRATAVIRVAGLYGDPTVRPALESWIFKKKIKKKIQLKLKTTGGISNGKEGIFLSFWVKRVTCIAHYLVSVYLNSTK